LTIAPGVQQAPKWAKPAAEPQAEIVVRWVQYSIDSDRHLSECREPCKAKESIIPRNPHSARKEGFS
jgi:hypothetical protein